MAEVTGTGDRRLTLFIVCAVAGIAPLMVKMNLVVFLLRGSSLGPAGLPDDLVSYLPLAAPVIALVVWHRYPGRSWPWLLLVGTVFAIPVLLAAVGLPLTVTGTSRDVVSILLQCAPAANLVGVLGAAAWLHQRERRATAAAVVGTALLCQLVGAAVVLTAGLDAVTFSRAVTVVLFLAGAAGALGAILLSLRDPMPVERGPDVRTTVVGAAGAASAVLLLLWRPDLMDVDGPGYYFLQIGLVLLAIGVLLGALGGPRVLLAAAASGLVIGPFGMLVEPSVEILGQFPVTAILAVLVSTVIAYAAAASRFRLPFAVGGLTAVAVGMMVLFVLFNADDPLRTSDPFNQVFTPILVVIGVIAVGCALAGTGAALGDEAAGPAVLAGASTPFALGAIAVITHFAEHHPEGVAPIVGLLPPAIIGIVIAATLLAVLARATGVRRPEPEEVYQA